jgi:hypothetical protein
LNLEVEKPDPQKGESSLFSLETKEYSGGFNFNSPSASTSLFGGKDKTEKEKSGAWNFEFNPQKA